MIRKNRY
jgi:hypothetical protein